MYNAANNGWAQIKYNETDNIIETNRGIKNSGLDWRLSENSANSFVCANEGNFGIGTDSPDSKLHINDGTNVNLKVGNVGGELQIKTTNDADTAYSPMVLRASEYNILSGNVGIGTTSPGTKLQVGSGSGATVDTGYQMVIDSAGIAGLQILSATTQSGRIVFGDSGDNDIGMIKYDHTDNSMGFRTNGSGNERMRIDSVGNVGIGTASPDQKLQVGGNFHIYDEVGNTDASLFMTTGSSDTTTVKIASNGTSYLNGGNVGIGTGVPLNKFVVSNNGAEGLEIVPAVAAGQTLIQAYNRGDASYDILEFNALSYEFDVTGGVNTYISTVGFWGINETDPDELLHITSSVSTKPVLKIENTNTDNLGCGIEFLKTSTGSASDGDAIGYIDFWSLDSGDAETHYAYMTGKIADVTAGQEAGELQLHVRMNNTMREMFTIDGCYSDVDEGQIAFNEAGQFMDFRVETVGQTHSFYIKGDTGLVGINSAAPVAQLYVNSSGSSVAHFDGHQGEGLAIDSTTNGRIDVIGYDHGATSFNPIVIRSSVTSTIRVETDGSCTIAGPLQVTDGTSGWTYESIVATTSGTSILLSSSIPSWATEIEVFFDGVSTNTNYQPPVVAIGPSTGVVTSSYYCVVFNITSTTDLESSYTDGFHPFLDANLSAAEAVEGQVTLKRFDPAEHKWLAEGKSITAVTEFNSMSGHTTLSGALTQVQLVTPAGAATFDAGRARLRYR